MIDQAQKNENARNYLKAALFQGPDWIPCSVGIMPATWRKYREELEDVLLDFPRFFPWLKKGAVDFELPGDKRYQAGQFTDNWGCLWDNIAEGLDGAVVGHPLEDWDDFDSYQPPDPVTQGEGWGPAPDWQQRRQACARAKQEGRLAWGYVEHGSMYMRLYYLRGFSNFMIDVATEEPRLDELIQSVLSYNMATIEKHLECGAEIMSFGDDLGFQKSLAISPVKWRRYIGPCFRRMFGRCRQADVLIRLHSDGHMLEIIPDLIQYGVTIINPQIRANGLDGLEQVAKGRVCLDLDLDRQLFPFVGPQEIKEHIREAVSRLNLPEGGLMLYAECEPDIPLANVRAICEEFDTIGGPGA